MPSSLLTALGWLLAVTPEGLPARLRRSGGGRPVARAAPAPAAALEPPPRLPGPAAGPGSRRMARLLPAPGRDRPLSLATPFLSERADPPDRPPGALRRRLGRTLAGGRARTRGPVVLATLHLALWESQTWLKLLSPVPLPEFGIIFRPLDNAGRRRLREADPRAFRDAAFVPQGRVRRGPGDPARERLRRASSSTRTRADRAPDDPLWPGLLDDRAARAPRGEVRGRGSHVLSPPHGLLARDL